MTGFETKGLQDILTFACKSNGKQTLENPRQLVTLAAASNYGRVTFGCQESRAGTGSITSGNNGPVMPIVTSLLSKRPLPTYLANVVSNKRTGRFQKQKLYHHWHQDKFFVMLHPDSRTAVSKEPLSWSTDEERLHCCIHIKRTDLIETI